MYVNGNPVMGVDPTGHWYHNFDCGFHVSVGEHGWHFGGGAYENKNYPEYQNRNPQVQSQQNIPKKTTENEKLFNAYTKRKEALNNFQKKNASFSSDNQMENDFNKKELQFKTNIAQKNLINYEEWLQYNKWGIANKEFKNKFKVTEPPKLEDDSILGNDDFIQENFKKLQDQQNNLLQQPQVQQIENSNVRLLLNNQNEQENIEQHSIDTQLGFVE